MVEKSPGVPRRGDARRHRERHKAAARETQKAVSGTRIGAAIHRFPSASGWNYPFDRKIDPADDVLGSDPASIGSDCDPLGLIEGDLVADAVVKLGGARAFMRGHGLGVFERAARL